MRRHQLNAADVIEREPEAPRDAAEAAAERQAADAGVRHGAGGRHEPVRHALVVHVTEQAATRDVRDLCIGIDAHTAQQRQIDHHPTVTGRFTGWAVAAAFDCDEEIRFARKVDRILDVGGAARLHDQRRELVHLRVDDAARLVVDGMPRQHEVAPQAIAELLHGRASERDAGAVAGYGIDIGIDRSGAAEDGGPH